MERPQVSDWLRNERRTLVEALDRAAAAMHEGSVSLREAHERIKYLESQNAELRKELAALVDKQMS